jgi:hypothetical protein
MSFLSGNNFDLKREKNNTHRNPPLTQRIEKRKYIYKTPHRSIDGKMKKKKNPSGDVCKMRS